MILYTTYLPFNFDGIALRWVIIVKKGQDSIIPHEMVHIEQQKRVGFFKYMFKYLTSPHFRVQMEFGAYYSGSRMTFANATAQAEKYRNTLIPFA